MCRLRDDGSAVRWPKRRPFGRYDPVGESLINHSDFRIGLEFVGNSGFRWRCTDVGTRTVLAICLNHASPNWYLGPPYIAKEVVFDEEEIVRCYLTEQEAIWAALREGAATPHPGYPAEAVKRMMAAQRAHPYPHEGVLRFDRCRPDGEILHPYAGRQQQGAWMIDVYLPFQNVYDAIAEDDFIAFPRATVCDIRRRTARS